MIRFRRQRERSAEQPAAAGAEVPDRAKERTITRRVGPLVVAGLAGLGLAATRTEKAEASYVPGGGTSGGSIAGGDLVDTALAVTSLLTINETAQGYTYGTGWWSGVNIVQKTPSNYLQHQFVFNGLLRAGWTMDNGGQLVFSNFNGVNDVVPRFSVAPSGNFGIGCQFASWTLEVMGTAGLHGALFINGLTAIDGSGTATKSYYAQ